MKCRNAPCSVSHGRSGIRRRAGASRQPLASRSCREAGLLAPPAAPLWFWDRLKLSCSTAVRCAYAPVHSEVFAFWSLTKGRSEDTEAVSLLGWQQSRASSKHSWTWAPLPRFPYTSAAMTSQCSLQRETLCWHWVSRVSLGCVCPWKCQRCNYTQEWRQCWSITESFDVWTHTAAITKHLFAKLLPFNWIFRVILNSSL